MAVAKRCRVAVQATGHGAVALAGDAILVHTDRLDECSLDTAAQSARIGAGATWQQVLDVVTPQGLAAVCGSSVNVGPAGFLTGGGIGPLSRPLGMASDYLTALEVVTGEARSDGSPRRAGRTCSGLLRGGKSYLGIVTAVELRLLPITELYGGSVFFDGSDLAGVSPVWRDWASGLPATADSSLAIMQMPPLPQVPPPLAGKITVSVRYADLAASTEAESTVAPLLATATPIFGGMGCCRTEGSVRSTTTRSRRPRPPTATRCSRRCRTTPSITSFGWPDPAAGRRKPSSRSVSSGVPLPTDRPGLGVHRGSGAAYNVYVSGNPNASSPKTLLAHGTHCCRLCPAAAPARN